MTLLGPVKLKLWVKLEVESHISYITIQHIVKQEHTAEVRQNIHFKISVTTFQGIMGHMSVCKLGTIPQLDKAGTKDTNRK